jgi:hypothetical protein
MNVGRVKRYPEDMRRVAITGFRSCENVALLAREIGIQGRADRHRRQESVQAKGIASLANAIPATFRRVSNLRNYLRRFRALQPAV